MVVKGLPGAAFCDGGEHDRSALSGLEIGALAGLLLGADKTDIPGA
jgi:hypothetical protein